MTNPRRMQMATSGSAVSCTEADGNEVLIIHSDSTDGSTDFEDSSDDDRDVDGVGNAEHSTDQVHTGFGATTIKFDGSGSGSSITKLVVPDDDVWAFGGTGNHTVDFWVRVTSLGTSGAQWLATWGPDGGWSLIPWNLMMLNGSGYVRLEASNNGSAGLSMVTDTALVAGAWTHVAVVRNGSNWQIYLNGVSRASTTNSLTVLNYSSRICFGGSDNIYPLTGYMDEIRVVNGSAVWTSGFDVPEEPYCS